MMTYWESGQSSMRASRLLGGGACVDEHPAAQLALSSQERCDPGRV